MKLRFSNDLRQSRMAHHAGLVCEVLSCMAYIHEQCDHCRKSLCIICIDDHLCPNGPCSSNSASVANAISSAVAAVAVSTASAPAVQNRAAFERNKKRAVLDLLAQESNKCPKYSSTDTVVDVRTYPLTALTMSANRSWLWNHFKRITVKVGTPEVMTWADSHAACDICCERALTEVNVKWAVSYTSAKSPGHLERHMKQYHNEIIVERRKVLAADEMHGKSITSYFKKHADFEELYLKWAVHTFQPLNTIEGDHFRAMCRSLSPEAPILTSFSVMKRLLQVQANIKFLFRKTLEDQHMAITLDHWTSIAKKNFLAQTAHFIDEHWILKSFTLTCCLHTGSSGGENTVVVST